MDMSRSHRSFVESYQYSLSPSYASAATTSTYNAISHSLLTRLHPKTFTPPTSTSVSTLQLKYTAKQQL